MTTLNLKSFAQLLTERLQSLFAGNRPMPRAVERILQPPSIEQESQAMEEESEAAFLARIAHLPEAERTASIQSRQWYAALATRQSIAEVKWRQQRYLETGNPLYRP